jgi:hypothetical protein
MKSTLRNWVAYLEEIPFAETVTTKILTYEELVRGNLNRRPSISSIAWHVRAMTHGSKPAVVRLDEFSKNIFG